MLSIFLAFPIQKPNQILPRVNRYLVIGMVKACCKGERHTPKTPVFVALSNLVLNLGHHMVSLGHRELIHQIPYSSDPHGCADFTSQTWKNDLLFQSVFNTELAQLWGMNILTKLSYPVYYIANIMLTDDWAYIYVFGNTITIVMQWKLPLLEYVISYLRSYLKC